MEYIIDAQSKKLGRAASEVAALLMGKNRKDFVRNAVPIVKVKVVNVSKLDIRNKKMESKKYISYSGYPSGLKTLSMKKVLMDKGYKEIFKKAVHGMLPSNKLRPIMMKNLEIKE